MTPRMRSRLACLYAAVTLLASAPVRADLDDSTIARTLQDGRFESLPVLAKAARGGDAVAMYWWGASLAACIVDTCRTDEGYGWIRRAAAAGNRRARLHLFSAPLEPVTAAAPYQGLPPPADSEERLAWATGIAVRHENIVAGSLAAAEVFADERARHPTMLSMTLAAGSGLPDTAADLRPILLAGTSAAAKLGSRLLNTYRFQRVPVADLVERAQRGDVALAVALCADHDSQFEFQDMRPDIVDLCERTLQGGHLAIAPVLLDHALKRGDSAAAERLARFCDEHPVDCGEALSEYEHARLGATRAWRDRDAVLAIAAGTVVSDPFPLAVWREGFSLRLRRADANRACLMRSWQPERAAFSEAPTCVWGRPIARR